MTANGVRHFLKRVFLTQFLPCYHRTTPCFSCASAAAPDSAHLPLILLDPLLRIAVIFLDRRFGGRCLCVLLKLFALKYPALRLSVLAGELLLTPVADTLTHRETSSIEHQNLLPGRSKVRATRLTGRNLMSQPLVIRGIKKSRPGWPAGVSKLLAGAMAAGVSYAFVVNTQSIGMQQVTKAFKP